MDHRHHGPSEAIPTTMKVDKSQQTTNHTSTYHAPTRGPEKTTDITKTRNPGHTWPTQSNWTRCTPTSPKPLTT